MTRDDLLALVDAALATVEDPEIRRPITELKMVKSRDVVDGVALVEVWLTVAGCPMRDTITSRVVDAVSAVAGVDRVEVTLDVMNDEQRKELRAGLVGHDQREIPFAQPGNLTRVYAIASGKGGVGKSSVTANLAVRMAASGLSVGLVDADIYGHSIPRLLGATDAPTMVEGMIMPPQAYGVRVISMLPFKPGGVSQPVAFRGPMLHRALQQFLADVWWGDLDVLLLDLPPGTGDVAISVAQLLPLAELIVVTTPQTAAAEVAIRAGMLAQQTKTRVGGVIENMSSFPCPHCGEPMDLFGSGGGQVVAETLSRELGTEVPLLGRVPFDVRLREGGDDGRPLVLTEPDAPASTVLREIADRLGTRARGLAGMSLGITPAGRA
jgi:ATP-binding protein involved in chromosome partitioning